MIKISEMSLHNVASLNLGTTQINKNFLHEGVKSSEIRGMPAASQSRLFFFIIECRGRYSDLEVKGDWRKLHNEDLHDLYFSLQL
jgi:hypothetical protein